MIATHKVTVEYYVSEGEGLEHPTLGKIRQLELLKWKALLGDALENMTVEKV